MVLASLEPLRPGTVVVIAAVLVGMRLVGTRRPSRCRSADGRWLPRSGRQPDRVERRSDRRRAVRSSVSGSDRTLGGRHEPPRRRGAPARRSGSRRRAHERGDGSRPSCRRSTYERAQHETGIGAVCPDPPNCASTVTVLAFVDVLQALADRVGADRRAHCATRSRGRPGTRVTFTPRPGGHGTGPSCVDLDGGLTDRDLRRGEHELVVRRNRADAPAPARLARVRPCSPAAQRSSVAS